MKNEQQINDALDAARNKYREIMGRADDFARQSANAFAASETVQGCTLHDRAKSLRTQAVELLREAEVVHADDMARLAAERAEAVAQARQKAEDDARNVMTPEQAQLVADLRSVQQRLLVVPRGAFKGLPDDLQSCIKSVAAVARMTADNADGVSF